MYLKNTSERVSIVLNTARGKVGIKPQEVVDIKYKILPPVSVSLKQVSEDEYLTFCEKRDGTVKAILEAKGEDTIQVTEMAKEERLDDLEKTEDEIIEPEIKDPSIMEFVANLIDRKEPQIEGNEALIVTETDSKDEAAEIEQQINDLKTAWTATKSPRKKEKIQKEINELKKQLKKIKK